jgi:hypothetical protein
MPVSSVERQSAVVAAVSKRVSAPQVCAVMAPRDLGWRAGLFRAVHFG